MGLLHKKLKSILGNSFGIKAHERILITGPAKWNNAIAAGCQDIGALPLIWVGSGQNHRPKGLQTRFRPVTDDQLLAIAEEIDAWVEACLPFPPLKKAEVGVVIPDWAAKIQERGARQCSLMVPQGPLRVRNAVTRALESDIEDMVALGKNLRDRLVSSRNVHVITEYGTDLDLELTRKEAVVDCGKWDPSLQIDNIIYMPGGVVEALPIETSVNGTVVVPRANLRRARSGWIKDLKLRFAEGRARALQAKSGLNTFNRIMEEATGNKEVIAEFGIGVNPNVHDLVGSMRLDELMWGSARVAIGDNYGWLGGKNRSDLHWDFILPKATLELDGKIVLEQGRFRID